jgi:S-DNA-T family DNA segregation ATPase FtsK/SpoIIIE
MVVVLLANGFEELEAITPVDVLRRNNIDVRTVSITNEKLITGTHGIQIATDLIASDVPLDGIDMLILPGGMPGVKNLDASPITKIFIDATLKNKGRLAAICAAPSIFGKHGMLTNIKATCFPGFESEMHNAILSSNNVVTDGIFTTAKDYKAAGAFADELVRICDQLGLKPHDENEEPVDVTEEDDALNFDDLLDFDFDDLFEIPEESENEPLSEDPISPRDVDNAEIASDVKTIIDTLASFNVTATIRGIDVGPRIARYEIVPGKGVKINSITNLYSDLALSLCKEGIRMEAPIPGKAAIGLEVPRSKPEILKLSEMFECEEYTSSEVKTLVPIGKDVAGNPIFGNVASFPHALISGATGMGKSVFINSILTSLISKNTPEDLKLILIDPKRVEFRNYDAIPHLLTPVITEPLEAAAALTWATEEMERRYGMIEAARVRNIETYNDKVKDAPELGSPMHRIVIVIDELADLMMQVRNPIEDHIMRIAQKARAAGIHLIIGTQRPSPNVITGVIKANIPTRVCFRVTSQVDSRTVLDLKGAECLLARGDMLYWPVGASAPIRAQSPFISDEEVEEITDKLREAGATYDTAATEAIKQIAKNISEKYRAQVNYDEEEEEDSLLNNNTFLDAVELAITSKKVSTSLLQRKLSIGYGKAAKFIDTMEELGIVSEPHGQKPRDVLMTLKEWQEKLERVKL